MSLKFKRNYPIILLLILVIVLFSLLGNQRVIAYTTQSGATAVTAESSKTAGGMDYANDVALLDDSLVHSIQVMIAQDDYDSMLATYQQTGLKEYFRADIILDGVRVNDVGIRLKGNASLQTALGGRGGMGRAFGGNGDIPAGAPAPGQQMPPAGERPARPEGGFQRPADGQAPGMPANGEMPGLPAGELPAGGFPAPGGMGMGEQVSAELIKLPFLIKFDEYIDGQTYQGYRKLSIRNYGISYDAAQLHEPLTNNMLRLAGLPGTQTAYAGFQINSDAERLYVISEILDEEYLAKYFENANGILYKSEVGSTLSYQGEEPSSYANSFSQETRLNDADLAPLIAFMRFLDQSDDATFAAELPDYLDVDSFATYLALNNLLVNTDSMIGMNNNYYLYYDDVAQRFTLLMWDANESLGKLGSNASYDLYFADTQPMGGRGGGAGMGGGPGGGDNVLMERFLANAGFKALYEAKLQAVYQLAFAGGALTEDAQRYSTLIHSINDERNLVDLPAYEQALQKLLTFIRQRTEYLQSTPLLGD